MSPTPSARRKAVADAVAGALASLVAQWVFYPVDVHKTRVQASKEYHLSSSDSNEAVSRRDRRHRQPTSAKAVWRDHLAGLELKTLHTCASSFCYFFIYSWMYSLWKRRQQRHHLRDRNDRPVKISSTTRLVLSAMAAMMNTCLTLPLDVLSSRGQVPKPEIVASTPQPNGTTSQDDALKGNNNHTVASDATIEDPLIKDVAHSPAYQSLERPVSPLPKPHWSYVASLWNGLYPSLLLCLNPAIHYTVYDALKGSWLRAKHNSSRAASCRRTASRSKQLKLPEAFLLGLVAKFVATLATYPLIRVKVQLMVSQDEDPHRRTQSLGACLVEEYRHHGIRRGWYHGFELQVLHTMLKSAVLMAVREKVTQATRTVILSKS